MIYLGADHRGFKLKNHIKHFLNKRGVPFKDLGALDLIPDDDYPIYARKVAESLHKPDDRGILICGSGHGVTVAANKVRGVRASVADNVESVIEGRRDDNLNVLSLPANHVSLTEAEEIVDVFLNTEFDGAMRHKRRLGEIENMENKDD